MNSLIGSRKVVWQMNQTSFSRLYLIMFCELHKFLYSRTGNSHSRSFPHQDLLFTFFHGKNYWDADPFNLKEYWMEYQRNCFGKKLSFESWSSSSFFLKGSRFFSLRHDSFVECSFNSFRLRLKLMWVVMSSVQKKKYIEGNIFFLLSVISCNSCISYGLWLYEAWIDEVMVRVGKINQYLANQSPFLKSITTFSRKRKREQGDIKHKQYESN